MKIKFQYASGKAVFDYKNDSATLEEAIDLLNNPNAVSYTHLDVYKRQERLEDHCDIIQSNTDGILVKLRHDDDFELIDDICWEWEKRTGMRLEFDEFQRVFQKDVNNYLIVPAGPLLDEKGKPRWKCKGAYVKKLSDLDYDLPIVNRAIVNYFLHDIPPEQTIMECSDLRDFQKVVKVSSKYKYAIYSPVITLEKIRDDKGRLKTVKRFSGGEVQTDKTFRVFASTDHSKGGIFKVSGKIVKGREKNPEQFANTPEHCFIVNGDLNGVPIPDELDKAYYIKMAWDRLKDFGIERIGGGAVSYTHLDVYKRQPEPLQNCKSATLPKSTIPVASASSCTRKALKPSRKL